MIPLYSAQQIHDVDAHTIAEEPIAPLDLMERAAEQLAEWILHQAFLEDKSFFIFCGSGNNGGDGLALARLLEEQGKEVQVFALKSSSYSEDFNKNKERLPMELQIIAEEADFPEIPINAVIIDALFGSGLNRAIEGIARDLIQYLNQQKLPKIAIDIPSGLFVDQYSLSDKAVVFQADFTLTFQYPKLNFLLPEQGEKVGSGVVLNIGLIDPHLPTKNFFITEADAKGMLKNRKDNSHKGNLGHGVLLAGSKGKMGAAILAAKAAMRSGMGLLSVQLPAIGLNPMQTHFPEAMCLVDENEDFISTFKNYNAFNALAIGPGMGQEDESQLVLKRIIQDAALPMVIDADAINILSLNKTWLSFLTKGTILTPHPGEFKRLVGDWENENERLELQREFSVKYQIYVVLKGKHTSISAPDGKVFFNSTGNAGMATAGSGDTLTGIILSLLAQNYAPEQAAILGVFLHGRAGDLAAEDLGEEALIASDISDYLPNAFRSLRD